MKLFQVDLYVQSNINVTDDFCSEWNIRYKTLDSWPGGKRVMYVGSKQALEELMINCFDKDPIGGMIEIEPFQGFSAEIMDLGFDKYSEIFTKLVNELEKDPDKWFRENGYK